MKLYLAYGSNLNVQQMALRCPKARPIGRTQLKDHRLVFRGVADIEWSEGDHVECGLWWITKDCEKALDRYEGVGSGLYRRIEFKVTHAGKPETCLVYQMNSKSYNLPFRGYLETIADGYDDFNIPQDSLAIALDMTRELVKSRKRPQPQSGAMCLRTPGTEAA